MNFELHIRDDDSVYWPGVDTGKATVVAHNKNRKLIALKISGHTTWAGDGKLYGPAHFTVFEYKQIGTFESGQYGAKSPGIIIETKELFGVLNWPTRKVRN